MKILIVEDSKAIATAFNVILSSEGYKIDVVGSADEAGDLKLSDYSVFLIDLMLPDQRGDVFAKKVLTMNNDAVVLITTNMGSGYDKKALIDLGVKEIVLKSKLGPQELRDLVAKYS